MSWKAFSKINFEMNRMKLTIKLSGNKIFQNAQGLINRIETEVVERQKIETNINFKEKKVKLQKSKL